MSILCLSLSKLYNRVVFLKLLQVHNWAVFAKPLQAKMSSLYRSFSKLSVTTNGSGYNERNVGLCFETLKLKLNK